MSTEALVSPISSALIPYDLLIIKFPTLLSYMGAHHRHLSPLLVPEGHVVVDDDFESSRFSETGDIGYIIPVDLWDDIQEAQRRLDDLSGIAFSCPYRRYEND